MCESLFNRIRNYLRNILRAGTTTFCSLHDPLFDDDFLSTLQIDDAVRNQLTEVRRLWQATLHGIPNRRRFNGYVPQAAHVAVNVTENIENIDELLTNIKRELFRNERNKSIFNDYIQSKAIDEVIIIGGCAEIPKIRAILREFFEETRLSSHRFHPKETVAIGAAYQAAILGIGYHFNSIIFERFSKDTLPFSIGIEDYYGNMEKILNRGSKFPIEGKKIFTRGFRRDGQNLILKVYEGEKQKTRENHFIGQLIIQNINVPLQIEVSLRVDRCGIVGLTIKDTSRNGTTQASKVFNEAEGLLGTSERNQVMSEEEKIQFLRLTRFYPNSTRETLNYGYLASLFEQSLISPISPNILVELQNLNTIGDQANVVFDFPFTDGNSRVESVKLEKVYNSQARPKLLLCNPCNKKIIFKTGDNLYDDQICMGFLNVFNAIWRHSNRNFVWTRSNIENSHFIFNKCYKVVPIRESCPMSGFIEHIQSEPAQIIWDRNIFRDFQHKKNDLVNALSHGGNDYVRLIASTIGTFVSIFVLGIGDRHQNNMLVSNDHSFFNIDFGHSFGEQPLLDTGDFPIPKFLINYLIASKKWEDFKDQIWLALKDLMVYKDLFDHLANKYMQDAHKLERAKATFNTTLNQEKVREKLIKNKIENGFLQKLPKDIFHTFFN